MQEETHSNNHESGYDRILKYTGVFGGVQTLANLITLVKSKLVAHFIGPAGMGIAYAFNRTIDLVSKTTDLGISFSAVKTIAERTEEGIRELRDESCETVSADALSRELVVVRSWSLWLGIIGTVACFLLAPLFSRLSFDGDYGYTLSFRLLAVVVGCTSVTGAERAILKGTHQLKQLAVNQMAVVLATLVVAVPLYMWRGMQGIVPVLVLTAVSTLLLTCACSFRAFPYHVNLFSKKIFCDGSYIVRLGLNYTIAGFLGSGVLFLVSSYMLEHGTAEDVGFYSNAVILASYLSMLVFSAVETDFYPRLSAVHKDRDASCRLVNEQTEVLVLLTAPLVAVFIVFLPIIIPLLLKRSFMPMLDCSMWAALALFFTALTRPLSFMSLSHGDSFTYLMQELFYDLFMAAAVIIGYREGGLQWAGIALFVSSVFDWLLNLTITRIRYRYRVNGKVRRYALLNGTLLAAVALSLWLFDGWIRWSVGGVLMLVVCAVSLYFLSKETNLLKKMADRLKMKK